MKIFSRLILTISFIVISFSLVARETKFLDRAGLVAPTSDEQSQIISDIQKDSFTRKVLSAQKVNSRVSDANSIEGLWLFTFSDEYSQVPQGPISFYYEASIDDDGIVSFINLDDFELTLKAQYDEENGILSFSNRFVTTTSSFLYAVYVYQDPFIYDWINQTTVYGPIKGSYTNNSNGGVITFPADCGIEWTVYGEPDSQNEEDYLGTIFIADILNAKTSEYVFNDDSSEWNDIGNAKLQDGWVLPALGIDQTIAANQYEVPMQQHKIRPSLYRLVNPYKYGPAATYNECQRPGYIVIDVTDPNMVLINPGAVDAGFTNKELGITRFLCYNQVMYYQLRYNLDPIYVPLIFPNIPITTYKNGIIKMDSGYDAGEQLVYDSNFGAQDYWYGGGQWFNSEDQNLNMSTVIWFPGSFTAIESVMDETSPVVKYYNLQGQEVNNPVAGELLIKLEGKKASKVIVR